MNPYRVSGQYTTTYYPQTTEIIPNETQTMVPRFDPRPPTRADSLVNSAYGPRLIEASSFYSEPFTTNPDTNESRSHSRSYSRARRRDDSRERGSSPEPLPWAFNPVNPRSKRDISPASRKSPTIPGPSVSFSGSGRSNYIETASFNGLRKPPGYYNNSNTRGDTFSDQTEKKKSSQQTENPWEPDMNLAPTFPPHRPGSSPTPGSRGQIPGT